MSFEQRNKEYFDKMADSYDAKPWQKQITSQVSDAIRASLDWIGVDWTSASGDPGRQVRLLDYACGPGTVARALGPYVTQTVGIDLSPAMVDRFNHLAQEVGLPRERIHAVIGNLLDTSAEDLLSGEEYSHFDVAAIGLGFHHFEQRALMLQRIAQRLKPGGVLLIVDFLLESPPSDETLRQHQVDSKHTIAVAGFTEQDMREAYDEAGFVDFSLKRMDEPLRMYHGEKVREKIGFLARGRKP